MDENSKGGRPSKYKEEYCQLLIDHMAKGYSFESFAGVVGVARSTLYEWESSAPAFSDAKREGLEKNLVFWETQGIEGLYNTTDYNEDGKPIRSKSINASVFIFNMKNRHKWRDKQPDESEVVINNVNGMSDTDLDAKIAEKLKKLGEKD